MAAKTAVDTNETIIQLEDVSFSYPGQGIVHDQIRFSLRRGERIGLIGSNGSGKSTLLHLIMGLLTPDAGTLTLFGQEMKEEKDFRKSRQKIGFVFQNADDQLFCPTVIEDVAFGPLNMGKKPEEALELSRQVLKLLHLEEFADRVTYKLSGGEKKLISFATVLVMQPEVLLLDEPTTGLDKKTVRRMTEILNNLEIGYLVVSHEFDFLRSVTTDIYAMKEGRIDYESRAEQFQKSDPPEKPVTC